MWRGRTVEHWRSEVRSSTYKKTMQPKITLLCSQKKYSINTPFVCFFWVVGGGVRGVVLSMVIAYLMLQCFIHVSKSLSLSPSLSQYKCPIPRVNAAVSWNLRYVFSPHEKSELCWQILPEETNTSNSGLLPNYLPVQNPSHPTYCHRHSSVQGLLCATVVTLGWNRYLNKS